MPTKTVLFDISYHGFGHLAQSAPVIDRLKSRLPALRVVLRARHPREVVAGFVLSDIEVLPGPPEATMVAPSATSIDLDASAREYSRLHADWDAIVDQQSRAMRDLRVDLVVSNVNPVSLAAAQRSSIKNVGFCCMNWLDIYRQYFSARPDAETITRGMAEAYAGCDMFLQPRPHMDMEELPRRRSIGPVARKGENRKDELRRRLGLAQDAKIVLLTFGGLPDPLAQEPPRIDGVHWLMRRAIAPHRRDVTAVESLSVPILDLIFSADAVLGKDSYCTVVEAALAGAGLVMTPRRDWPETRCLAEWATQNCNFALAPGPDRLATALHGVLAAEPAPPVESNGVDEAVDAIAALGGL